MAELINSRLADKRVIFPRGEQTGFLLRAREELSLSWPDFAKKLRFQKRTLTDWKREKYSISLGALEKISAVVGMKVPKNIEIKDRFWYVGKGAKAGGAAMYRKYGRVGGDPEHRKKRWREWWEREGRYRKDLITAVTKPIRKPPFSSGLAEAIGIILGDGGIAKFQVTVTLNRYTDREYANYVKNLFSRLFKVVPSIYERERESVISIVISRRELVSFLVKLGLNIGGKVRQQTAVPGWIEESGNRSKACLRGLFDTDGCFYVDKHKYRDKTYFNAGMNFTNRSLPILHFFKARLEKFGFHPTQKTKFSIFIRKEKEIIRYFREVGSSNPKHSNKFEHYLKLIGGGVG